MNRERNSWTPRQHGFDNDRPPAHPQPRMGNLRPDRENPFSADPTLSAAQGGQPIAGIVKWFNEQKGYGFVELAGGQGDAFLHINVLQSSGRQIAPAGANVLVTVNAGDRGPQVASVLEIDASGVAAMRAVRPPFAVRPPRGPRRPDPSTAIPLRGKVKWFDETRGFGFVASEDGGRDIFVHISTLNASGLQQLSEGQLISMRVVETPKGREAIAIAG